MGYRISLYCTPKEQVDAIREITYKDVVETDFDILHQLEGELIKYDTLANVLDTGHEEELNLCTRIFKNNLDVECEESFYTISKEQLKNIIYYICQHNNYEHMLDRDVDYDKKEVGKWYKERFWFVDERFDVSVRSLCVDHQNKTNKWKTYTDKNGDTKCANVDLDSKWFVTDAWTYEYYVFNLVHLYKIFDWDNNYLVAIGG